MKKAPWINENPKKGVEIIQAVAYNGASTVHTLLPDIFEQWAKNHPILELEGRALSKSIKLHRTCAWSLGFIKNGKKILRTVYVVRESRAQIELGELYMQ